MTLYIIGIGLADQQDISVKGLEIVKSCDLVYLENYTSLLQCSFHDLAKFYDKEIILADRNTTEQGDHKIIEEAKNLDVAFLVIGDPFSATTHVELMKQAKEHGIEVRIINNASILTAIGVTGLQLYKFGKTASIPFLDDHPNLETPYNVLKENNDMHTLFLLDIQPPKFMTVNQAIKTLIDIEGRKKENLITDETLVIGCARLGSGDPFIKSGMIKDIKDIDFGRPPHCLIIPGKMHFLEEEIFNLYSSNS
jgi:diphthine synthase